MPFRSSFSVNGTLPDQASPGFTNFFEKWIAHRLFPVVESAVLTPGFAAVCAATGTDVTSSLVGLTV